MHTGALNFRVFLLIALLPAVDDTSAQTVDWWDPIAVAEAPFPTTHRFPGMSDVAASPWGIYGVGTTQCDNISPRFRAVCKGLLVKYDANGRRQWRKVLKYRDDTWIKAVVADESGVYVHGTYRWGEHQFPNDVSFVHKYAHDGTLQWQFLDSEGNPQGYRIGRIQAQALVLHDGYLYAASRRNRGSILRKFTLDGELVWLVPAVAVGSLAAGDGVIYGSEGSHRGGGLHKETWFQAWDTDGNLVSSFPTETIAENGLAFHDGALYFCAREGDTTQDIYSLNKMQPDGALVWRIAYGRALHRPQGCGVHVDDSGVTVAVNLAIKPAPEYPVNLTARRYDFDGQEIYRWDYPSLIAMTNAVSVLEDEVYIAGFDSETVFSGSGYGYGIVGKLSGGPLLKPALARLDGATPGSAERLAVLDHNYGAGSVSAGVQVPGSDTGDIVFFSEGLRPVDFFATDDLTGNGRDELVVLSKVPAVVEIVDGTTGDLHVGIELDDDFEPIAAVIAYAGAIPVLAVLNRHYSKSYVRVDSFDARTGASLGTIPFNPGHAPLDLFALPSGSDLRYAVLAVDDTGNSPGLLEIRNAEGSLDRNLRLGKSMTPLRGLIYDEGGEPRIAVLRQNVAEKWLDVVVVNPDMGVLSECGVQPAVRARRLRVFTRCRC